jgi:hypothetical protein
MIKSTRFGKAPLMVVLMGVICVGLISACGGRRNQSNNQATGVPQAAPAATATVRPFPTAIPDTPTVVPATATNVSPTVAATAVPPMAVPPTAAPAQSNKSGDALEQLLNQLDAANAAGDNLSDVPEIK